MIVRHNIRVSTTCGRRVGPQPDGRYYVEAVPIVRGLCNEALSGAKPPRASLPDIAGPIEMVEWFSLRPLRVNDSCGAEANSAGREARIRTYSFQPRAQVQTSSEQNCA